MNYTPLYIKTHNSLLSSLIKETDLIEYALNNDLTSLTITDNNMYGVMDFYHLCIKNNIKPIIGLEVEIDGLKIVLYGKNYVGYQNLMSLSTMMSESNITYDILKEKSSNLICVVPFNSMSLYEKLEEIYVDIFKGYSNYLERNKLNGNNLIYINEVLCLNKKDVDYLKYLESIKTGIPVSEIEIDNNDCYIRCDIKSEYPDDLKNNKYIVDNCNITIKKDSNLLPIYDCPNNLSSYEYLKKLCVDGMKKIFGSTAPKVYIDRLKYELEIINKMGFCNYFLVVWDYVKYAKENDILVGPGRGSAAGSLVSYLLNITTVDPIKYNLLFERFLNPERVTMPDIDIDFEYTRREEVVEYCINKYGIKKVAPIITFGTLGAKQAVRDVGRGLNISLKSIDVLCNLIDSKLTLVENYKQNKKIKDYLDINQNLKKLYKIASKIEGLKRHTSIHAAGIVMSNVNLDTVIPLDKSHGTFYTTGYSMDYLEELGLLKMDFLALRNLSLIKDVLKEIPELTFDTIPMDDKKAINIFTSVNTSGIFQFESQGMMNFLRKFKPDSFEDVVASIALFRPGPMNNIDSYIKRKQGKEKIDYIDPSLEGILKPTYGIIIYQEQIMQIANVMAGYSFGEADILRRAMSKKKEDVMLAEKDKFIERSIKRGYTKEIAEKVYNLILKFASYGFNRAHSVAYSVIAYKMAYLKSHYPYLYMNSLLTMNIGSESKIKEYIYECRLNNINILPPNINESSNIFKVDGNNIRYPLTGIKSVGVNVINSILEERSKGNFKDIYDFINRCYGKSVNKKNIENLIFAGCFDTFGYNRNTLYTNLDMLLNYGEIGGILESDDSLKPVIKEVDEYPRKELLLNELSVFGFYLSGHPTLDYKLKYPKVANLSDLSVYFDRNIETIVYVEKIKEIKTKKDEKMVFITGSDELTTVDIVLFPRIYNEYNNFSVGDVLKITGKVEKRFDKLQIVLRTLEKLD